MRGLGILALVVAAVSALCAVSVFYSPIAYIAGAVAIPLAVMARGDQRSRVLGTVALVVAVTAVVVATVLLIKVF
jgi:hypothetical protein